MTKHRVYRADRERLVLGQKEDFTTWRSILCVCVCVRERDAGWGGGRDRQTNKQRERESERDLDRVKTKESQGESCTPRQSGSSRQAARRFQREDAPEARSEDSRNTHEQIPHLSVTVRTYRTAVSPPPFRVTKHGVCVPSPLCRENLSSCTGRSSHSDGEPGRE